MTVMIKTRQELGKWIVGVARITGEFKLRSGAMSDVYFDKYRFEANPDILKAIAEQMSELIPDGTERLIGLEMGGIPLVTAISMHTGIPGGFCRKKAKEYGTCLQVEGGVENGEKVTIIEDVITSGGAAIEAIKALREMDCEILGLLCVVDRESGGAEKFKEMEVNFEPLYKMSELENLTN
jgi:orotate phosphoribosyltransferase